MTDPNQKPSEESIHEAALDAAIRERDLNWANLQKMHEHKNEIVKVIAAERDNLSIKYERACKDAAEFAKEIDQLRADLKLAVEALEYLANHNASHQWVRTPARKALARIKRGDK